MPILFLIIFLGSCSSGLKTDIKTDLDVQVYPQLGHSHIVNTAVFSSDGRHIVSSSWDMSVKLWDADSGRERATFLGHTDTVDCAAISRDGRTVASASHDGTVRIWSTETEKETARIEERGAYAVAFGTDDTTIFTLSGNGIKQWDTKEGRLIKTLTEENFAQASFSPDNIYVVSGAVELTIWNVETGHNYTVKNNRPLASAITISNDGTYIAMGGWDGKVSLVKTANGESIEFQAHAGEVSAVAFSNDTLYLATASKDRKIILWDISNSKNIYPVKDFSGHDGNINAVSFSPDDRSIISASSDKTIKAWNLASAEAITLGGYSAPPVVSVISRDNQYIASFDRTGSLKIWNAKTGVFIESFDNIGAIRSMVFSTENENLITVSPEGTIGSVSIKTGRVRQSPVENNKAAAIFRSLDSHGKNTVSVLWDGTIEIRDIENGQRKILEHGDEILTGAAGLDQQGKYLATGFINGALQITDLENNKILVSLLYESPVEALGFSTDGRRLALGLRDGSVRLLDASTGREMVPAMGHFSGVSSVSFSEDGSRIISAATDNSINLWDAETGGKIASFISYNDNEWITITPDGYYIASPRGDERLNVRIGGEIYGMDQFSAIFSQAEVINARLECLPDPAHVTQAESRILAPPAIQISAPLESDTDRAEIGVSVKDRFRELSTIQIVINGRLMGAEELMFANADASISVENTSIVIKESADGPVNELAFTIPVNLEAGSNRVQVIATNRETNQSTTGAEGRKSVYIVNTSGANLPLSDAWVMAIGSNGSLSGRGEDNLRYAVNNARGIISLFESQRGKRYLNVHTRLIDDGEMIFPTRENILESIREFFGRANSSDVLILFLSGHGEYREDSGGYYFLPQAISLDDISILADMPGRKIIFIDSCFSGGVDDKRLAGILKNQSTAIITSSQKDERSWEGSAALAYGFFTEALITGIGGEAAVNNEVRLINLGEYVYNKVKLLSGGMQNPYVYVPEGFWGFVVAVNNQQ